MRKSLVAISFIFLGFNSLIAADAPAPQEKPALPVQTFTVVNKVQTTNKVFPSNVIPIKLPFECQCLLYIQKNPIKHLLNI